VTRAEAFDKAWRVGAKEKDFSFVDEIYHADYYSSDVFTEVKVNLDEDKSVYMALAESLIITPPKTVLENGDSLQLQYFNKYRDADIFNSVTTLLSYNNGKIISQHTTLEELDYDPSEGQDWIWEDYM
tara:strand:+ start:1495 stop:1878 length:384 start_codon:yes stop_codon:yes gene_type:complete